jgi:hypothetical protein
MKSCLYNFSPPSRRGGDWSRKKDFNPTIDDPGAKWKKNYIDKHYLFLRDWNHPDPLSVRMKDQSLALVWLVLLAFLRPF